MLLADLVYELLCAMYPFQFKVLARRDLTTTFALTKKLELGPGRQSKWRVRDRLINVCRENMERRRTHV